MAQKEFEISVPEGYSFKELRDGKIVFEKDTLPTSWSEYRDNYPITAGECFVDTKGYIITFDKDQDRDSIRLANVIKNADTAKAFLALNKLIHLRDCYRQGWLPNWRDAKQLKYGIIICHDNINRDASCSQQQFLSFQTSGVRDMFLKNFRDLIEQAKELL